jgi:hypothetical protein
VTTVRKLGLVLLAIVLIALVPGGAAVVVVAVSRSRAEFLRLIAGEVARQLEELRPDLTAEQRLEAARILAAQAALESGYGKTRAFREGFNFGNVSAGASWAGPVILGGDLEYSVGGEVKRITQRWRKYGSLAEAVSDFFLLLSWSRYRPARAALFAGDAAAYAARLRNDDPSTATIEGGYYTAPLAEYQAGLSSALTASRKAVA